MVRYACVVLIAIGVSLVATGGYADFYRWVDRNGTIWLTDDPVKFPSASKGEFERVLTNGTGSGSQGAGTNGFGETIAPDRTAFSAEAFLKARMRRAEERKGLETTISALEEDLAVAERALRRLSLTDRRGYWFVIDPQGNKVRASYKDPGAIWSTQTWPAVPRAARTKESEERRRIQADIARIERDLGKTRQQLATFSRSF